MRLRDGAVFFLLASAAVSAAFADEPAPDACADSTTVVSVQHLGNKGRKMQTVLLTEGQAFRVCIRDTSASDFTYSLYSVEPMERTEAQRAASRGGPLKLQNVLWPPKDKPPVIHSAAFRGYVLEIRSEASAPLQVKCVPVGRAESDATDCELDNLEVTLEVPSARWDVEAEGGFIVSGLIDPRYYLDTSSGSSIVREDEDAQDAARLGIAAFASLYHRRYPYWNILSFGLGVNDSGRTTYYFGTGLRFGGKARLVGGAAVGQVDALPTGVKVGQPPPNDTVLNNLGRRTAWSWFVGVTFGFTGSGVDDLKKPFAPPPAPKKE